MSLEYTRNRNFVSVFLAEVLITKQVRSSRKPLSDLGDGAGRGCVTGMTRMSTWAETSWKAKQDGKMELMSCGIV